MLKNYKSILRLFASAKFAYYLIIYFIAILIIGTISQKYIGLYASQKLFFDSYIIWIYKYIPVAGGKLVLAIMFFALLARLALYRINKKNIGTIISHLGIMILLLSGVVNQGSYIEGNMVLGNQKNYINDYYSSELVIRKHSKTSIKEIVFSQDAIESGKILQHKEIPFSIKVQDYLANSALVKKTEKLEQFNKSLSAIFDLIAIKDELQRESNNYGIKVKIDGIKDSGNYIIYESMPIPQIILHNNNEYQILIRKKRHYLNFMVKLNNFQKLNYINSNNAKDYVSNIQIIDNDINISAEISMNQPFSYNNYTFYQSEYIITDTEIQSVIAVVFNQMKYLPYIAMIISCLGILIHIFARLI